MKELIDDYQRRLKTINEMIERLPKHMDGTEDVTTVRLTTKASCYRTFLSELERLPKEE